MIIVNVVSSRAQDEIAITGKLYFNQDGNESSPNGKGRVHLGYWDKKDFKTALKAAQDDPQGISGSAIGHASVAEDGTFRLVADKKAIPKGITLLGMHYEGGGRYIVQNANGEPIKIRLRDGRKAIDLSQTRLEAKDRIKFMCRPSGKLLLCEGGL